MKKLFTVLLTVLLAGIGFVATAEEVTDSDWESVVGVVKTVKDDNGKITSIKLVIESIDEDDNEVLIVADVKLDEQSLKLAQVEGKKVEVHGIVKDVGNEDQEKLEITVKKFSLVKQAELDEEEE